MKLASGNPAQFLLGAAQQDIFLRLHVQAFDEEQRLDFHLLHMGTLVPIAAEALRAALADALNARVEQIRSDEYAAGYRAGRLHQAKRNWAPASLIPKVFEQ